MPVCGPRGPPAGPRWNVGELGNRAGRPGPRTRCMAGVDRNADPGQPRTSGRDARMSALARVRLSRFLDGDTNADSYASHQRGRRRLLHRVVPRAGASQRLLLVARLHVEAARPARARRRRVRLPVARHDEQDGRLGAVRHEVRPRPQHPPRQDPTTERLPTCRERGGVAIIRRAARNPPPQQTSPNRVTLTEGAPKMFIPRVHQNGGICCSSPEILCAKCKVHFADQANEPPDPYAEPIAALRAAQKIVPVGWPEGHELQPRVLSQSQRTADPADAAEYDAPDPYAAGVAAMRGAR